MAGDWQLAPVGMMCLQLRINDRMWAPLCPLYKES